MSEVLFGQSYYLRFDPKLWDAGQPYPPLGSLYAAAYARSRGYDVGLFDAMLADSEQRWAEALDRHAPKFAVLFEDNFNYLSKMCLLRMRAAAYKMLAMARTRGCTVIAAGSDATDHAAEYLAHGAQFVLAGEGEATLAELLDHLSRRGATALEEIRGIAFLNEQGRVVATPRRPDLHDLDALPFPAWDLVDVERYRRLWMARHGYFSMNLVTTRGCPFHCNWCAKPIWGQRYNVRSPENVVAEMRWLHERFHPDHLWFADDILGLKPGWLERFADLLEQEALRIPFKSLNRADLLLKPQVIPALARAGAHIVWIGAESGSQKILDAMEKGTRVEQIYEAARRLRAAGVRVGFFLQFGYPGETRADIERTLKMVRDCRPDDIGVSVSYPLPGTRFYQRVRAELGAKQNWIDSQDLDMLYRGPFGAPFYRQLHGVVHKEFRMRRTADELARVLRREAPARRGLAGRALRMVYQWASLPLDRLRLGRLAGAERQESLPPELDTEAAAQPSPQADA